MDIEKSIKSLFASAWNKVSPNGEFPPEERKTSLPSGADGTVIEVTCTGNLPSEIPAEWRSAITELGMALAQFHAGYICLNRVLSIKSDLSPEHKNILLIAAQSLFISGEESINTKLKDIIDFEGAAKPGELKLKVNLRNPQKKGDV